VNYELNGLFKKLASASVSEYGERFTRPLGMDEAVDFTRT